MKRFLLAALAVATLAGGTAEAADMGAPPPPVRKVAPPVAVYSWSGPYWGVNVGYSWGRLSNDWTVSGLAAGSASETQDLNGVIGGFGIVPGPFVFWGYRWRVNSNSDFVHCDNATAA